MALLEQTAAAVAADGIYLRRWKSGFGLNARQNPGLFCYLMLLTSGLAYAIAVWCIFRIGLHAGLPWSDSLALASSAALATMAITYMQAVNDHTSSSQS